MGQKPNDEATQDVALAGETTLDRASTERLHTIYVQSFPPRERDDLDGLLARVAEGSRQLFVARRIPSLKLIGFSLTVPLPRANAQLLEYMAVSATERNRGIGHRLLELTKRALRAEGCSGIVLEVEPPEDAHGEERRLRRRRIDFYRRNGAQVADCARGYRMPDLSGDGDVPMLLLWIPLDRSVSPPKRERLRLVVSEIFHTAYQRPEEDPLLEANLASLAC